MVLEIQVIAATPIVEQMQLV